MPLCVSMSAQLPRTGLKMRNCILVRLAGGNVVDQKVWTGVGTLWYLPVFPRLRRGGNTSLPVSKRPGTGVLGRWLSTRLRRPFASTPFVWLCDVRRPTYTDHLRRPVFCRCWPTSVELFANRTKTIWQSIGQFKRRLKTHLFGLLDHSAYSNFL